MIPSLRQPANLCDTKDRRAVSPKRLPHPLSASLPAVLGSQHRAPPAHPGLRCSGQLASLHPGETRVGVTHSSPLILCVLLCKFSIWRPACLGRWEIKQNNFCENTCAHGFPLDLRQPFPGDSPSLRAKYLRFQLGISLPGER